MTGGASTLDCARPARARGGAKEAISENLPSLESPISKAKGIRENHTAPGILRLFLNVDFRFPFVPITGSTMGCMQTGLDRAAARSTGALGVQVGPCVPKGPCFREAEGFCQPSYSEPGHPDNLQSFQVLSESLRVFTALENDPLDARVQAILTWAQGIWRSGSLGSTQHEPLFFKWLVTY